jgi:hypothetical protein
MPCEPLESEVVMRNINISTTEKTTVFMRRIIAKGEFGGSLTGEFGDSPRILRILGTVPELPVPELPF